MVHGLETLVALNEKAAIEQKKSKGGGTSIPIGNRVQIRNWLPPAGWSAVPTDMNGKPFSSDGPKRGILAEATARINDGKKIDATDAIGTKSDARTASSTP